MEKKKVYVVEYRDLTETFVYEDKYEAIVDVIRDYAMEIANYEEDYTPEDIAINLMGLIEKGVLDNLIEIKECEVVERK